MPKATDSASTLETPLVFKVEIPPMPNFNKDTGKFDPPTFYSTPAWVKYGEKVRVTEGQASTDDIEIAMEFVNTGAIVTPDPRPIWQERYAAELKAECENNPARLWELSRYVKETNVWRAAHGFKPLSVEAPQVGRPVSALVMGMGQG